MSKLALVTGASAGIGRAFAQRLAAGGSTDEGMDEIAAACAKQPLTMLVTNAGVAHYILSSPPPNDRASVKDIAGR